MRDTTKKIFEELFTRYNQLSVCKDDVRSAFETIAKTYRADGKLLLCGNGGSASDCEHIVGELMKNIKKNRRIDSRIEKDLNKYPHGEILKNTLQGGLGAVSLTSHPSFSTAFSNDADPNFVFAQQLYVLGRKNDTLLCISTSGNSMNCVYAVEVAKAKGMKTVSLTGRKNSLLSELSDVTVRVPETETYKIQELHLPVYHCLCAMLEEETF
ncbi:MAG: SIS domain-containing protein [Clostridia bacterium]|nr:SIS domain-containing protein [Clostridia bacterium]